MIDMILGIMLKQAAGNTINLFKELGLENMPLEEQAKLIERMTNVVYERIILRILDQLSEDDAKAISESFDTGDQKKIMRILDEKVPNIEKIVAEEIASFQKEMLR